MARPQGLGEREASISDCANNPNCQGFTWIQAGTADGTRAIQWSNGLVSYRQ
jgi:hypothetical protein